MHQYTCFASDPATEDQGQNEWGDTRTNEARGAQASSTARSLHPFRSRYEGSFKAEAASSAGNGPWCMIATAFKTTCTTCRTDAPAAPYEGCLHDRSQSLRRTHSQPQGARFRAGCRHRRLHARRARGEAARRRMAGVGRPDGQPPERPVRLRAARHGNRRDLLRARPVRRGAAVLLPDRRRPPALRTGDQGPVRPARFRARAQPRHDPVLPGIHLRPRRGHPVQGRAKARAGRVPPLRSAGARARPLLGAGLRARRVEDPR